MVTESEKANKQTAEKLCHWLLEYTSINHTNWTVWIVTIIVVVTLWLVPVISFSFLPSIDVVPNFNYKLFATAPSKSAKSSGGCQIDGPIDTHYKCIHFCYDWFSPWLNYIPQIDRWLIRPHYTTLLLRHSATRAFYYYKLISTVAFDCAQKVTHFFSSSIWRKGNVAKMIRMKW